MLKWTEYKQKIDVCYQSLYRKEFEVSWFFRNYQTYLTLFFLDNLLWCKGREDYHHRRMFQGGRFIHLWVLTQVLFYYRNYENCGRIHQDSVAGNWEVQVSFQLRKLFTDGSLCSSEITKTYGKEVVEVKNTMNSVKDILKSESFVKKKTENRQEYEVTELTLSLNRDTPWLIPASFRLSSQLSKTLRSSRVGWHMSVRRQKSARKERRSWRKSIGKPLRSGSFSFTMFFIL